MLTADVSYDSSKLLQAIDEVVTPCTFSSVSIDLDAFSFDVTEPATARLKPPFSWQPTPSEAFRL